MRGETQERIFCASCSPLGKYSARANLTLSLTCFLPLTAIFLTFFNQTGIYTCQFHVLPYCPALFQCRKHRGFYSISWADAWLQLKADPPLPGAPFHFAMARTVGLAIMGSFTLDLTSKKIYYLKPGTYTDKGTLLAVISSSALPGDTRFASRGRLSSGRSLWERWEAHRGVQNSTGGIWSLKDIPDSRLLIFPHQCSTENKNYAPWESQTQHL